MFPDTSGIGTRTIQISPLSANLTEGESVAPPLLKIDAQGFELGVLEGREDLLNRFPWIYAECSFVELYKEQAYAGQVMAWLKERGFVLRGMYNASYDACCNAVQADLLFDRVV